MNDERASERPPRRFTGAGGAFKRGEGTRRAGGAGAGTGARADAGTPSEPGPGGAGRRRSGAAQPLAPADLAAALQRSVAQLGGYGPPRAGLARIRRKAKARQRRRTVLAGSAGVVFMVMAVGVISGNSFDIVPVLTGVVGLGGHEGTASDSPSPVPDGAGQVRTVRPTAGRKGPAIGPGLVTPAPSALAATGVGACGAADLTTVASVDSVIGGVSYGHVEAVAQRTCAVAGPPVLQVDNSAGNAAGSVVILQHAAADGSRLPQVSTWGAVLVLHPGAGYDFQFAWAPDGCTAPGADAAPSMSSSAGATAATSTGSGGASPGAGSPAAGTYQLSYLVTATSPTSPVTLGARCGATVYVTDVYPRGSYPLPKPDPVTPSPLPSSSSPVPNPPAGTPAPSSAPPPVPSASPTPSSGPTGTSPAAPAASPGLASPISGPTTGQTAAH